MSIEVAIFLLRLLAGISLVAFLLTLFAVIMRQMRQSEALLKLSAESQGYLLREDEPAERHALRPPLTLGRASSNSIVVDDAFASALHAQISESEGKLWLEDCQSRNGTRLNGEPIGGRTILADGDVIGIGKWRYRLALSTRE